MSNLEQAPAVTWSGDGPGLAVAPVREQSTAREVPLGADTVVRRALPHRERRLIGAWCLLDHFGPDDIRGGPGMRVAPHPHTGIQTVTWLVDGEVFHRDSLGNAQTIRPGQLNLMTSGRGIAHSEESPADHPPLLHGLQLWVALPDRDRTMAPAFEHHATLPTMGADGVEITVLAGACRGVRSPASIFSPLVGLDIRLRRGAATTVPLERAFEHGAVVLAGNVVVDGVPLAPGTLLYLGLGRDHLTVRADEPGTLFLFGGEPFQEPLVMWWNFVARTGEEIAAARDDWEARRHFGDVRGYDGARLPAPPLPTARLRPRR